MNSTNELPPRNELAWFIILPAAHEGPYSYEELIKKFMSQNVVGKTQVWRKGMKGPITFQTLQELYTLAKDAQGSVSSKA